MKNEIEQKIFAYLPENFDGVLLDINSNAESVCPDAQIVFVKDTSGISAQEDSSADLAFCTELHKLGDIEAALDEIYRVLKDDGIFIACLEPDDAFRTKLKELFNVNSYRTQEQYAYFEAEKRI